MVTHTVVLTGGSADKKTQTIRGLMELKCRYATLTQVIVQLTEAANQVPIKAGMVRPVSKTAIPAQGLYGLSLRFPPGVIPSYATSEAGSEGEAHSNHRIPIYIDQQNQTTIYKPNALFRDVTFSSHYDVEMFYLDCDHEQLSAETLAKIHSVSLVFHCEVDQLMPG